MVTHSEKESHSRYRSAIYIRKSDIRAILSAGNRKLKPETYLALSSLLLVKTFQDDPALPPVEQSNEYAVLQILIETLTILLARNRLLMDLDDRTEFEKRTHYEKAIQLDGNTGSSVLIGLSYIYHCQVKFELNISQNEFADLCNVVTRTLRRYQDEAITEIWNYLIAKEKALRISRQRDRLKSRIPHPPINFFGRDTEIEESLSLLEHSRSAKIFVSGAPGIGKSTFVQKLLYKMINETPEALLKDNVLWLECSPDANTTIGRICAELIPESINISLNKWFVLHDVLIVIENIDNLSSTSEIKELMSFMSSCSVVMISNTFVSVPGCDMNIVLGGLDIQTIGKIAGRIVPGGVSESELRSIYHFSHGNPTIARVMTTNLTRGDRFVDMEPINALLASTMRNLSDEEQSGLLIFAFFEDQVWVDLTYLCDIISEKLPVKEITKRLLKKGVIEVQTVYKHTKYRIYSYVRSFLYETQPIEVWAKALDCINRRDPPGDMFIQDILGHARLPFTTTHLFQVCKQDFSDWYHVRSEKFEIEAHLKHIWTLRHTGQTYDAELKIHEMVRYFGEEGEFVKQSYFLLEKGKLLRLKGKYQSALEIFEKVNSVAGRYGQLHLVELSFISMAQVAIDEQNYFLADDYLQQIEKTSIEIEMMRLEVALGTGGHVFVLNQVSQLWEDPSLDSRVYGKLHNLLGRSWFVQKQYTQAERCFRAAISFYETTQDTLSLGRVYVNLAATLIELHSGSTAMEYLQHAEQIQIKTQDRVGLLVNYHNMSMYNT